MSTAVLLDLAAETYPDRAAIGTIGATLTFAELNERAHGAACLLRATGARSVAFLGLSGPALHVAVFAAARARLPLAPLNYRLADEQLAALLDQLDAPVLVADRNHLSRLSGSAGSVPSAELLSASGTAAPATELADADPAVVLFTSGTTSEPKGVLLRHEHLVSYVLQTVNPASASEQDAALVCVPPYHIAGIGTVLTNTVAGRRVVHLPEFTPEGWLETIRREGITTAMVVPTMLARVVEHLGSRPAATPTLRSLAYGGARISPSVLEKALRAFPETGFVNAYGLTETSSTIALLDAEDHRAALRATDPVERVRLGSVGRVIPGVEAQVRGSHGDVLPAGEVGELWVRGPQVSGAYLGGGSAVDEKGWFATRDRVHIDTQGYLFVEGRADDTIIRGGENIAPSEIEDVLVGHDAVREAAAVGLPDDEWGELLVAVVVLNDGCAASATMLKDFVRARLRGSRTPDRVVFREELPTNSMGKLLRRELVAELSGTAHRQPHPG